MRVAQITQTLTQGSWFGGGINVPVNLSLALGERGIDVDLYSFSWNPKEEWLSCKVKSSVLGYWRFSSVADNPMSSRIIPKLLKGKYDVIHYHQYHTTLLIPCLITARITGARFVLTDHGGGGISPMKLGPIREIVNRSIDKFLLMSEFSASLPDRGFTSFREKMELMYGGVDEKKFHPSKKDLKLRERLSPDGKPVILFAGRVLPHKGVDVLLKACARLKRRVKVVVAGGMLQEHYKAVLDRIISENNLDVSFEGYLPEEDLARYYTSSDIFVLPSVYTDCFGHYSKAPELFGLVVLEAMASGKPVVASSVGGVPEIVLDGKTGLLYPSGDVGKLAESLDYLLSDEKAAERMGLEGRKRVEEKFTWSKIAEHVAECYNSLLDAKK